MRICYKRRRASSAFCDMGPNQKRTIGFSPARRSLCTIDAALFVRLIPPLQVAAPLDYVLTKAVFQRVEGRLQAAVLPLARVFPQSKLALSRLKPADPYTHQP